MEEIRPTDGTILVEVTTRHEQATEDVERRASKAGLELRLKKPEFQGVPNMGIVYCIADGEQDFKVGERIVFNVEDKPKGFKFGDVKLFAVPKDKIMAKVEV